MEMQCYLEGRHAYRIGVKASDCPYTIITDSRRLAWIHGWSDELVGAPMTTDY